MVVHHPRYDGGPRFNSWPVQIFYRPFRTFTTSTTALHLAMKPLSRLTINEAAVVHGLPNLIPAISTFFAQQNDLDNSMLNGDRRLQVWHKLCVQQTSYHNKATLEAPQTLRSIPPSTTNPYGLMIPLSLALCPRAIGRGVALLAILWSNCGLFFVFWDRTYLLPMCSPSMLPPDLALTTHVP